jgi:hypothetical protein
MVQVSNRWMKNELAQVSNRWMKNELAQLYMDEEWVGPSKYTWMKNGLAQVSIHG